jgi:hypothetical protein
MLQVTGVPFTSKGLHELLWYWVWAPRNWRLRLNLIASSFLLSTAISRGIPINSPFWVQLRGCTINLQVQFCLILAINQQVLPFRWWLSRISIDSAELGVHHSVKLRGNLLGIQIADQMYRFLAMELRDPKELPAATVRLPLGWIVIFLQLGLKDIGWTAPRQQRIQDVLSIQLVLYIHFLWKPVSCRGI